MESAIATLKDTPIPTILVIAGIAFLLLAIAGQLAGRIAVAPERQPVAAVIGGVLLTAGVVLYVVPLPQGGSASQPSSNNPLPPPITSEIATPRMFRRRAALGAVIDRLDATKAKALVAKIGAEFTEIESFIDKQYPSGTRAADAGGSKAKTVLKRAVRLTVRSPEDADKWQSAIGGL